jgi:hypothetical protein
MVNGRWLMFENDQIESCSEHCPLTIDHLLCPLIPLIDYSTPTKELRPVECRPGHKYSRYQI